MTDKNKIETYLKRCIPEFQSSPYLDSYLEAAGEFLDSVKKQITDFDHIKDYEVIGIGGLNKRLKERGNDLPRALPIAFKRNWYRDIAKHKAMFGTEAALSHALSSIGIVGEIRSTWLLSPELLEDSKFRDPSDHSIKDLPTDSIIDGNFRTNFVYGDLVVTADGTFLGGHEYFDSDKANQRIYHISGEAYNSPINKTVQFVAAKTPYIIVTFDREDFNINAGEYVDPETGETYEYSQAEEAVLMDEIIRFFSLGENRATTIKIFLVIVDKFDDEFSVDDDVIEDNFYALSKFYPVHAVDDPVFSEISPVGVGGHWEDEPLDLVEEVVVEVTHGDDIQDDDASMSEELAENNFLSFTKAYGVVAPDELVYADDSMVLTGGQWVTEEVGVGVQVGYETTYVPRYDELFGKPVSTSTAIESTVDSVHVHEDGNSLLDNIGENAEGMLEYKNRIVGLRWSIQEW